MARATRAEILAAGERGEREVIASIGSGKNPDGTDFDLSVSLPAGTNNIGDVDVLSLPQPTSIGLAGTGELAGSATALQMPTLTCKYVRYKARVTNAGNVYIGGASVTKPDGTTDTTTGFSLTPGDDTGWIPVTNTNLFYRICDNATDALTFIALV